LKKKEIKRGDSLVESRAPLLKNKSALGRGLRSLIPTPSSFLVNESYSESLLQQLLVDDLVAGKSQPRYHFDEQALKELTDSIIEHGVLQPLVVRRCEDGQFEIVAGERRWRAAKRANLKTVPCIISSVASKDALIVALVENIQREDLNVIEEAESYKKLSEDVGLTQEQIAQAVGKDRATVANALRLLKLPQATQALVVEKKMSMGHARALLALRDVDLIQQIADQIAEESMSVRRTEQLVQEKLRNKSKKASAFLKDRGNEAVAEKEARRKLEKIFGTKVEFRNREGKGIIAIHFYSNDQLNDILERVEVVL
jgi:ParB family transcriptional regulator, chromosome partitioning protein